MDQHIKGADEGLTCIDSHKGIAHQLSDMYEEDRSAVLAVHEQPELIVLRGNSRERIFERSVGTKA